jgi:hypothetical protein
MAGTYPSPQATVSVSVGTVSVLVVPLNLSRSGLYVFNPGAVVLWICPITTNNGLPLAASVGGAGSIAVQPQQGLIFGGSGLPHFTNGMNAIAASGGSNPITCWEYFQ